MPPFVGAPKILGHGPTMSAPASWPLCTSGAFRWICMGSANCIARRADRLRGLDLDGKRGNARAVHHKERLLHPDAYANTRLQPTSRAEASSHISNVLSKTA